MGRKDIFEKYCPMNGNDILDDTGDLSSVIQSECVHPRVSVDANANIINDLDKSVAAKSVSKKRKRTKSHNVVRQTKKRKKQKDAADKALKCKYCGKGYTYPGSLEKHEKNTCLQRPMDDD